LASIKPLKANMSHSIFNEEDRKKRVSYLLRDEDLVNPFKTGKVKKTDKMANLSKKELKKLKYKKAHKKNYMQINELHLKQYDPFHDFDKLKQEQQMEPTKVQQLKEKQKKQKKFVSPIPPYRTQQLYPNVTDKGYVTLETSLGILNIELYCDKAPKTCDNFLMLCERGAYNGTSFHRLIKDFMVQGGQTVSGQSAWGSPFENEIVDSLKHDSRGILSMANSGLNTNQCQFFICFVPCQHLDGKHSVFGKVVGGLDILEDIENVKTMGSDQPAKDIKIERVIIYSNPFKDALEDNDNEEEQEDQ
jgi:cyclophilin family peptidyl-prolyl cis-trans isomerase